MNCRNVFQIYLYLENCMTIRASLQVLEKGIFIEKVKLLGDIPVRNSPLQKSIAQVSL